MPYPFPDPSAPLPTVNWEDYHVKDGSVAAARAYAAQLQAELQARVKAIPTKEECEALAEWTLDNRRGDVEAAVEFFIGGVAQQSLRNRVIVDLFVKHAVHELFQRMAAKQKSRSK